MEGSLIKASLLDENEGLNEGILDTPLPPATFNGPQLTTKNASTASVRWSDVAGDSKDNDNGQDNGRSQLSDASPNSSASRRRSSGQQLDEGTLRQHSDLFAKMVNVHGAGGAAAWLFGPNRDKYLRDNILEALSRQAYGSLHIDGPRWHATVRNACARYAILPADFRQRLELLGDRTPRVAIESLAKFPRRFNFEDAVAVLDQQRQKRISALEESGSNVALRRLIADDAIAALQEVLDGQPSELGKRSAETPEHTLATKRARRSAVSHSSSSEIVILSLPMEC